MGRKKGTLMSEFIQRAALDLQSAFVHKTRDNGEKFVCTIDDCADWISEAIFAAHDGGGIGPNDFTFCTAESIADSFVEALAVDHGRDLVEVAEECTDSLIPAYNSQRVAWLASHGARQSYVDGAISEYGWPNDGCIMQALAYGMAYEISMIGNALLAAIISRADILEGEA